MPSIYIVGSLRNPAVQDVAEELRNLGWEVFDDWFAAGPEADDYWQKYEERRGRTYEEALQGHANWNVFQFDHGHLMEADAALMIMPAGKSCHLELGFTIGAGKRGFVLFDREPERWDAMYRFCEKVFFNNEYMLDYLAQHKEGSPHGQFGERFPGQPCLDAERLGYQTSLAL